MAVSQPRRVLVTGASGFVGGSLLRALRSAGVDAIGVGRRASDAPGYVRHDLGEPISFDSWGRIDAVVHAAARASPWGRRSQFERDNVIATRNVIDAAVRNGCDRFVYISSSSVYYRPQHQIGINEQTPLPGRQINDYSATKRKGERLVERFPGRWTILRPRAVFGPGDTVLLPRIVQAAKRGQLPLLELRGIEVVGDLIYIDNLIDAIVQTLKTPEAVGTINLTNNEPVPILSFLIDILKCLGIPAPTRRVSVAQAMRFAAMLELFYGLFLPDHEPPMTRFGVHVFAYSKTFDVSRMVAALGPPKIGNAEAVERTVAWFQGGDPSTAPRNF